ncbi:MAG: hypothetical protein MJK04_30495 [Psychrosphaera sp.]|nr:hypothetical protein [Psychrosphaera sp.]
MNIVENTRLVTDLKSKAADMLKLITQGERDVKDGDVISHDKVFDDLEAQLLEGKSR